MNHYATKLLTLVMFGLLLAACQSIAVPPSGEESHSSAENLAGSAWILSSLEGQAPLSDSTITLRFTTEGSVSGSDGCNMYRGSYAVEGSTIHFGDNFAATMMACPQPVMDQAGTFMKVLKRAAIFTIENGQLHLRDGSSTQVARFAAQDENIAGTSWKITAYNNGRQAIVSVIIGTKITATFGEDGRITGSAGCNSYFASYEVENEALKIGPTGATRKFCAEPKSLMEQESHYLEALQSAATFRITGEKMELRRAEGALAVTLARNTGGAGAR